MSLWSRLERRLGDLAGELLLDEYRDQVARARTLMAAGDVAEAAAILEALLVDRPGHGAALVLLGAARLALRQPADALSSFEYALAVRGNDPEALVGKGEALLALGRPADALAPLTRAIDEARGERGLLADAYTGLGLAWRRAGDLDKAVRELRKAVAEAPTDARARAALGDALLADDRTSSEEARRHLDKALEAADPPAIAFLALGRIALADQLADTAAQHFERARALSDADPTAPGRAELLDALIGLGDAALARRDVAAAHQSYLRALQLDPRRAELHARVAGAHASIGDHEAALVSYQRALDLGAGLPVLRAALDAALQVGDLGRAVLLANDVLGVLPDDPRALVARARAMAADGQREPARALLRLALSRGDDLDAHVALAGLELAEPGRPAGARAAAAAHAALRVDPASLAARDVLAQARARELGHGDAGGDIRRLAEHLELIVGSRPDLAALVGDVARASADLDTPLLVTVMGEFSSGKSSFVNAFIGAEVAPTGITPTTATINVVRYGRERGGRIVQRDGSSTTLAWDALFPALRALDADAARAIDRVEILVPLPQLEQINIVDTPGLNSILPEHEETARAFIARADAVVWVFTAGQGGKASERRALERIRAEGKRVLGVLNKRDQLSATEIAEVVGHIGEQLGDLVEVIVPFSARRALAYKRAVTRDQEVDDGAWSQLAGALEARFFTQARQLKRDACVRRLGAVIEAARAAIEPQRAAAATAATETRDAAAARDTAATAFLDEVVGRERASLAQATTALYRRAAREVLDLVRPRRLPFGQHTATPADRDYLIALLDDGYEAALELGRRRVADDLRREAAAAIQASQRLAGVLGGEPAGDLARVGDDRARLALAQVFDRTRAFLRGYLQGGYVEAFFRNDLPRLELSEDTVYHALVRGSADLDRELALPLARAGAAALDAIARRLEHWAGAAEVLAYDLDVGVGRALDDLQAQLADPP